MNLAPNQNIKQIKSKSDEKNYESNLNGSNLNTQRENTFTCDKPKESNEINLSKCDANYKVIKELTSGDYFGELSVLTNLPITCTIHSINNMIVSTIEKEDFIKFLDDFGTCKTIINNKMYEYNDSYFQSLHKLIENIPVLKALSFNSLRSIVLKLKKKIVRKNSVILNLKEISTKTFLIYSGKVRVSVYDPKTKMLFPFQYLNDGSNFNFINSLLGYESLFSIEAISTCTLYILEEKDLQQAACDDFILKNTLWEIKAKFSICGERYDYNYHNKNLSVRSINKSESLNIKIECFDKTSGKCSSRKESGYLENYQSGKSEIMQYVHRETLCPNSIDTRLVATPRSRGNRKYHKILSKIHKMRFILIQKLKDSKVLFEIIDTNFYSRARINSLISTNEELNSEYKSQRMFQILRPTILDLKDEFGQPVILKAEVESPSILKASEIKEFKEEKMHQTLCQNQLKPPEVKTHKRSKSRTTIQIGDMEIDDIIKSIVQQQIISENLTSAKDLRKSKRSKSRRRVRSKKKKPDSSSVVNQENIIISPKEQDPINEVEKRSYSASKNQAELLSNNISKARTKYTTKMAYVHSLNVVINKKFGSLKDSLNQYFEK